MARGEVRKSSRVIDQQSSLVVVRMLCAGRTKKQIAYCMDITERSVWRRIKWLMTRHGLLTEQHVIAWAVQHQHASYQTPHCVAFTEARSNA